MGLLDWVFGKKEEISKSSEMLDEELYWRLIDNSLENSSNQEEQAGSLIDEIEKLSHKEMIGFRLRTDRFLHDTYGSEMWCVAYIVNGGCSDHGFEYFRHWLISRGKEAYYTVKENPDRLAEIVNPGVELYDFEAFRFVADDAFERKTGKDLDDFIDHDNFKTSEGNYPKFEFTWKEDDSESMKKICPKLYNMYLED